MVLGILKDDDDRVALTPDIVQRLSDSHQVFVEEGAGTTAFFSDSFYTDAGATITSAAEVVQKASLLIRINPPNEAALRSLPSGTIVISSFQPYNQPEIVEKLSEYPLTVFSMDMLPRTTLAQDKDVLSSMASMAGYRAVLEAATHLPRYFPMLTTAAGSIPPAKVLILGAGVAGLQAIATAKRLGAVVEAFDTRLAVKEEVQSLGAKFVEVQGATDDKDAGGYAVEQSEEYQQRQQALIREKSEKSDVIITTALLRGKKAPTLVTQATVESMKPGSVIVDLAAAGGGNCALTKNNETVSYQGVTIIGDSSLEAKMPMHASQLYAKNIFNFLKILIRDGEPVIDFDNPLIDNACIVHQGQPHYQVPQQA
ncbi:MAG: Re/Si-specific NAD(P)(+) transhydrogenase subunit alpha [Bacteroidota bacterium]